MHIICVFMIEMFLNSWFCPLVYVLMKNMSSSSPSSEASMTVSMGTTDDLVP